MRVNVGCGTSPTPGWRNFDNSPSLRLSQLPTVVRALRRLGLLRPEQEAFIDFARTHQIEYADGSQRLPLPDASVEVLYSSHMLEHLDRAAANAFLKEVNRVLRPGGLVRLAVPDLRLQLQHYLESKDADAFVRATYLAEERGTRLADRLRLLLIGARNHQWMYDGSSLCRLLRSSGFAEVEVVPAGTSSISDAAPLDLHEREDESVYVEARKPL